MGKILGNGGEPWYADCSPADVSIANWAGDREPNGPARPERIAGDPTVAKMLAYDEEARQKLASGVSKLARAVRSTLGPRGRNAVIDKGWGSPTVTKDGVTVAEEI